MVTISGVTRQGMRIALSSPVRKGAFLVGCLASLSLAWALCCQAAAERWLASSGTLENTRRAAHLQPLNAAHEETLGLILMDPAYGQFDEARTHLEKAVSMNPHSSRAWLNLANVYSVLGQDEMRFNAVQHALIAEPKDTRVQWEAANLFLANDLDRSLQLLRSVVESDPSYAASAAEVAYRASGNDVEKTMLAVPMKTTPRVQLMHWFLERQQNEAADRVWPSVLEASGPLAPRDVFFYLDDLIARHQPDKAFAAWKALVQRDPAFIKQFSVDNLVYNGDFQGEFLNGGFGWRYTPTSGVTPSIDTSTFHASNRSLELGIDATDTRDFGFHQLIKIEPGEHYRLSAWVHAEELEAAHGVRLGVEDAYSHNQIALTEEVLGSFPWREVSIDFTAPKGAELVNLSVVRSPANGRIKGKIWFDDVRLEKQ